MSDRPIFDWFLIAIYCGFTILRIYNKAKCRSEFKDMEKKEKEHRLNFLFFLIIYEIATFFIYLFAQFLIEWAQISLHPILQWFGVVLGIYSIVYFIRIHVELGKNWSHTLQIREKHQLIRTGPYKKIRHPMYTAFLLLHVSVFFLTANWFIGLTWLLGVSFVVISRINDEEKMLMEYFGKDYEEYMKETHKLIFFY